MCVLCVHVYVCMRGKEEGEGGRVCTCVETEAGSLLLFLPWWVLHAYWSASFQVIHLSLFPIWRCQCWYYRCGPLHQAFYMGFRTHSNRQSDLHHEGLYPKPSQWPRNFVCSAGDWSQGQANTFTSEPYPNPTLFFIWNHKIKPEHHGRVTINIFLNNQIHIKTLSPCLLPKCSKDFLLDIFFFISK